MPNKSKVGTKEDYEAESDFNPLGKFMREIAGLDIRKIIEQVNANALSV